MRQPSPISAFTAALLMLAAAPALAEERRDGPRPGDIFEGKDGVVVGGWRYWGGSLWGEKREHCCIAFFSRKGAIMLVVTERTRPDSRTSETVLRSFRLPNAGDSQETGDCVIDGRWMLIGVRDRKTDKVTGYWTDGQHLLSVTRPYRAVEADCSFDYPED